jgi:hypothetical protein
VPGFPPGFRLVPPRITLSLTEPSLFSRGTRRLSGQPLKILSRGKNSQNASTLLKPMQIYISQTWRSPPVQNAILNTSRKKGHAFFLVRVNLSTLAFGF